MIDDLKKHRFDYSLLATLAGIFIIYFLDSRSEPRKLVVATLCFSIGYFLWGVWHHGNTKTVTKHIVLEYFLVALIGIVIVSSLLL